MIKYFCASDIHSFYDEWMRALKQKGFDIANPDHKIIICGDLFDRGDQTLECFDFIKQLSDQNRLVYVRGNHEDLLEECVFGLEKHLHIGMHHKSNGTIKTIAHVLNKSEYDVLCHCYSAVEFEDKLISFLNYINEQTVDYFELDKAVFVHGWVPTTCDEDRTMIVHENWRDGGWRDARWENGMELWKFKLRPEKTVVCGHWHCSYGWSHIRQERKEFPQLNQKDCLKSFEPFIDEGIIAIDACTAYTHIVNVCVFDKHGNLID